MSRVQRPPCSSCGGPRGAHTYVCAAPRERHGWTEKSKRRRPGHQAAEVAATGPTVVNRHHFKGRSMPKPWLYIGRNDRDPSKASPLQNPFTVAEWGAKALDLYREFLTGLVDAGDPITLAELRKITPATSLVCSCSPRPCHGDVVVSVWRELGKRPPVDAVAEA